MTTTTVEQLDLFAEAPTVALSCMWHPGRDATHRVVIAHDLFAVSYPRLLTAATGWGLHIVGAPYCTDCATTGRGEWIDEYAHHHYIPITPGEERPHS